MVTVLRIKPGEKLRLLDGEGREGVFTVIETAKKYVTLAPVHIIIHERPEHRATLAVGYGRSVRRGWLLEKAVELESAAVWFWQAERSQGKVPEESKETWFAQMTAGAKQSNNPHLPLLKTLPGGAGELVSASASFDTKFILWEGYAREDTKGAKETKGAKGHVLSMDDLQSPGNTLFVLGPEGGFTEREISVLTSGGFVPVSLGNRVLRWETAAMLCLGLSWWARQEYQGVLCPF